MLKSLYSFLSTLLLAVVISIPVFAQDGDMLLTHHPLKVEGLDNVNFEIIVNANGQLIMANRSGILLYDGDQFDYISTPSAVLSISLDSANNLYIGCVGDFGKIDYSDNKYQYVSLNPNGEDEGLYFQTVRKDSDIYFASENNVIRYNITQNRTFINTLDNQDEYFTNMLQIGDSLLVQTNIEIFQLVNDSLTLADWMINADFLFFEKHPSLDKYLIGTTSNEILIYENGEFEESTISEFLEANESYVNHATWVNEDLFAVSTLENGCILYNQNKNQVLDVIDQNSGLPDNEINAIVADQEEGLWISHAFGLTRVEINMPFRSFSNFQGLDGNLTQVYFHDTTLFVSTSKGVYFLDREHVYKNTVYYTVKRTNTVAPKKSTVKKTPPATTTQKKKSLFSRKKKKNGKNGNTKFRKSNKSSTDDTTQEKKGLFNRIGNKLNDIKGQISKIDKKSSPNVKYVRHVRKDIVSTKYKFTKVQGLNSKIEKFINYRGKLLAAGTNGVYEITGRDAELIIHEPIRFVIPETNGDRLIIATHLNRIMLYELIDDIWMTVDDLDFHGEVVLNILSQGPGKTWFVTPRNLYEYDELTYETDQYTEYDIDNHYLDDSKLTIINQQLFLINSLGYYFLDTAKNVVLKDEELLSKIGQPVKHLQQTNGTVWIYNGQKWLRINQDKSIDELEVFGLFPEMTFIDQYKKDLWLIDDSKELLQYDAKLSDSLVWKNKMFFRKVKSNKGDINIADVMNFEHDENTISFELSRPDYLGLLQVEYQYQLKGLSPNWTEWSSNNKIDFNFLQPNNYELTVRSKDSFGNIQESHTIDFIIHPPYWQTLWFYALQIAVMAGLIILSVRMNRKAKKKNVIITEGLTILTLVMVIEFLQSAAGQYLDIKSTPVVDFGLDVAVALCVFPLEQFLKKYMKAETKGPGLQGKGLLDLVKPSRS